MMNAKWILMTFAAAVMVIFAGLTGCEKKKDVIDTPTAEKAVEAPASPEHPATEDPAAAKPKDHPAH